MIKEKIINAIGNNMENIAQKKASKCMFLIRQPKVPKKLIKRK